MDLLDKNKKLILVVDDEPMIINLTSEFLKEEGFDTCSAKNAAEALSQMEKQSADAVLLDIRLPDEDGLVFLKRLKEKYPNVPVVMLTGAGYDEERMQTALRYGASGYVSKDTEMEKKIAVLKQLLK